MKELIKTIESINKEKEVLLITLSKVPDTVEFSGVKKVYDYAEEHGICVIMQIDDDALCKCEVKTKAQTIEALKRKIAKLEESIKEDNGK